MSAKSGHEAGASSSRPLRNIVRLIDAVTTLLAILLATQLHEVARGYWPLLKPSPGSGTLVIYACLVVPLWVALAVYFRLDRLFEDPKAGLALLVRLFKLHLAGFAGVSILLLLTQLVFNRSITFGFLALSFAGMGTTRLVLLRWLRYRHASGSRTRILVVGDESSEVARFVEQAQAHALPPEIVGRVGAPSAAGDLPYLGEVTALAGILHDHPIDHVLFFPPFQDPATAGDALTACETVGVPAEFALSLDQRARATPRVVTLFDRTFVSFDVAPKRSDLLAVKHAFDVVAAIVLVLVLLPVFLVVALLVLVTMGRPIFFTQERGGVNGRKFRMYKFRTMVRDAAARHAELAAHNELTGPVFKITNDPRITRLGRFLRRSSIDELPQLFNVITGTMSLVGPRPLAFYEQQNVRGWHRRRLSMKPGITGLWQVSGRNNLDFEAWMELDLEYVDNWSLWLDAAILARTIPAVLFGRGAR